MNENQIKRIMEGLNCSRAEAEQILADDKAIDRGERMPFDLDKEKEKEAKKYLRTGTRKTPTAYNLDNKEGKRSRKENPTKATIISEIAQFLTENGYENVEITNKERQIALKVGENAFELTLVQKRQPKK